jgi:DNA invertase Pin-like site-specific DNA recombinase
MEQNKKETAAVYCRLARADKRAIEAQRLSLLDFAKAAGYTCCLEYADNGASGLTLDRPAFSDMDAGIRAGRISVVFVKDIARIGRNCISVAKWLDEMERLGVTVISANEGKLTCRGNEICRPRGILAQSGMI